MDTKKSAVVAAAELAHAGAESDVMRVGDTLATMLPGQLGYALVDQALDVAMAALDMAADDLREIRDGYRHTYPHPAARCRR